MPKQPTERNMQNTLAFGAGSFAPKKVGIAQKNRAHRVSSTVSMIRWVFSLYLVIGLLRLVFTVGIPTAEWVDLIGA